MNVTGSVGGMEVYSWIISTYVFLIGKKHPFSESTPAIQRKSGGLICVFSNQENTSLKKKEG
jgi:hypothetical protein